MKFKKIKSLILLCLFTSLTQTGFSDFLITDSWKFMQEKFINTPKAKAAKAVPVFAKLAIGFLTGSAAGLSSNYLLKVLYKKNDKKSLDYDSKSMLKTIRYLTTFTSSVGIGCLSYYVIHTNLVFHYQKKELIDLLNNWHQFESRVPSNLQQAFKQMHKIYKSNPSKIADEIDDIMRVLTEQINEKFEVKNSTSFLNSNFLYGQFIFGLGKTINSLTQLFKYFF